MKKYLHKLFKKLMGSDGKNAYDLENKKQEAISIKSDMIKDITKIRKNVDHINQDTYNKLTKISKDLDKISITYKIAIATGGKKRGL